MIKYLSLVYYIYTNIDLESDDPVEIAVALKSDDQVELIRFLKFIFKNLHVVSYQFVIVIDTSSHHLLFSKCAAEVHSLCRTALFCIYKIYIHRHNLNLVNISE